MSALPPPLTSHPHPNQPAARRVSHAVSGWIGSTALLLALLLAGCGGGDSASTASDTTQPLAGREVGKAGQLTGTWMRVSPGRYVGFEFLKDGKVLATVGSVGRTTTMDFSVLDGGRVSFVATGGLTTVYGAKIDGDILELAEESGARAGDVQRFRRLPSGQTLAAAIQEQAEALQAARLQRLAALEKLLAADDLVVIKAEEKGPPAVLAVKFDHWQPNIGGTVVMDDDPARDDVLRPVRVHPLAGSMAPLDDVTDRLQLQLEIRPATTPADQQDVIGRITLVADGPTDNTTLTGTAQFPKVWMGEATVMLKRDRRLAGDPTAKFEKQSEARQRAVALVSDPLGGRAVLTGQKTSQAGGNPQPIALTVERVGTTNSFQATAQLGDRDGLAATGDIGLVLGRGALYLNLPTGEQWRLHVDDAGKVYSGQWRPNTRADFLGHGAVELTLGRVWTNEQIAAEREAIRRFLNEDLRAPTAFIGFVQTGRADDTEHWPVWVELQTTADGTAAGKAWLLAQNVGVSLTGRLSGDSLQLNTAGALPGSANSRSLANQRWQLALAGIEPHPRFQGRMSSNIGGGGEVELVPASAVAAADARRALLAAVDGKAFTVVNTTISRRPDPSYFRFQVDASSGAITGDVIGADLTGSTSAALPPGLITGTITEVHGHTVLQLVVDSAPEPVRGRDGKRFEFTVTARALGDDLLLTGWDPPGPGNQTWLRLSPVAADTAVTVSDEQRLRLAAQRLGAVIAAPARPAAGDQVLLLVHATDRDARVGQIFSADGRYSHGNSVATAGIHAGVMRAGETAVLRLTYGAPFTAPTPPIAQNGVTSSQGTFRPNNTVPTFTLERVATE